MSVAPFSQHSSQICSSHDGQPNNWNQTTAFFCTYYYSKYSITLIVSCDCLRAVELPTDTIKHVANFCIILLKERMLTRRHTRHSGEYFTYSYALLFTNGFWTLVMSGILLSYFKPRTSRTTIVYEYSFSSILNMLSSWCQYEALKYVYFPHRTLSLALTKSSCFHLFIFSADCIEW